MVVSESVHCRTGYCHGRASDASGLRGVAAPGPSSYLGSGVAVYSSTEGVTGLLGWAQRLTVDNNTQQGAMVEMLLVH